MNQPAPSQPNPINELTEVRPSPVHGLGVFAKVDIPKGTVWWRADPERDVLLVRKDQYDTLKASTQSLISQGLLDAIHTYAYYVADKDAMVLILDHARFTNHSDEPNSEECPEPGVIGSIALRDIQAGEEIREDYNLFDQCPWEGFEEDAWAPGRDPVEG